MAVEERTLIAETTTQPAEAPSAPAPAEPMPLPVYKPDFTPELERLKPLHVTKGKALYREVLPGVMVVPADAVFALARKSSLWPLTFGLACCAIEMIATFMSDHDLDRFGIVPWPSPRQADVMIVSGTVTKKMVPAIVRIYNQMAEPRYVLSMGACATGGGPFKEGYTVVSGIDKYIPVDVYVPGCPPTPEALLYGLIKLHEKVERQSITTVPWYRKGASEAVPVPILGPDIFDPRKVQVIKEYTLGAAAATGGAAAATGRLQPQPIPEDVKARIRAAQAKYRAMKKQPA